MNLVQFFTLISEEHAKAIEKHPVFCNELCEVTRGTYDRLVITQQEINDDDEMAHNAHGDSVVMEEIYETFKAAYDNDLDAMAHEAAQACQCLFRAIQYKEKQLEGACRQSTN